MISGSSRGSSPMRANLPPVSTHWIGFGFSDSLDAALVACLRSMIKWTSRVAKLDPRDVYPLCSMAASFRITQFSDQTGSVYTSVPPRGTLHAAEKRLFAGVAGRDSASRNALSKVRKSRA